MEIEAENIHRQEKSGSDYQENQTQERNIKDTAVCAGPEFLNI